MKKIIFITTLLLSAAFTGCGDDDKTTLRWSNESQETVKDIKWWGDGDPVADATWNETRRDGEETSAKEITKFRGSGSALFEHNPGSGIFTEADIQLPGTNFVAEIEKNTDAMLVIDTYF